MANEQTLKDKIIKVFNMDSDEGYEDEEYYEDDMTESEEMISDEQPVRRSSGKRGINALAAAGSEVLVLEPECFNDAPVIVNKIRENKTVVVNLKNTEYEDGRKIFDFLNGAVFALDGTINKIAENVFILAPLEVSVSTEMEKRQDEYITPILDWDAE